MKTNPDLEPAQCHIIEQISKHAVTTLQDLAREIGADVSIVRAQIRKLQRKQLVVSGDGRGEIRLNREYGYLVGIDMGASHLHFALADFSGEVMNTLTEKIGPEDGPRKTIAQIKTGLRKLVPARKRGRLRGVALGVPGIVDPQSGLVLLANNLPGWTNINLKDELQKELRVPVFLENDANMAAIGEHWRGVAENAANFIFIALGTGIGAGVFINGQLFVGRGGAAGELFLMNVEWRRWQEDFGSTGHFEANVSGLGISSLARKLMKPAARSNWQKSREARFVFEAFHRGDPGARKVLETAFTILGVGIANIVAVMDPELIVLGGGISRGAPEFMLTRVTRVASRVQPGCPPICLSALEDKAQTHGAIFSAMMVACKAATFTTG